MRALRELRRFILVKSAEGNVHEVRLYIGANAESLARAFHVPVRLLIDAVQGVKDDGALATKFLETIVRAESLLRAKRKENRARSACESARNIGAMARWDGEKVWVDILSLLDSALTRRNDVMVFCGDGFEVAVRQSLLFDLARLKRRDLSAFVDANGLHVVWGTGHLNFYPHPPSEADRVVVPLPALPSVVAA